MKTMRLPNISPQPQQRHPVRLPPHIMPAPPGSLCKSAGGNLTYDQPYRSTMNTNQMSASIGNVSAIQSPPFLNLYRSTMNHLRSQQQQQQRSALVASLVNQKSSAREIILKKQLMQAVMKHQTDHDYLAFLRKYAEDATTSITSGNNTQQEFDYLDYIRRDAAEEFRRNGVEVSNFEGLHVHGNGNSRHVCCVAQVGEAKLLTSLADKGRLEPSTTGSGSMGHVDDSAILSYGEFTTTSMNNHEATSETGFDTYDDASPKKLDSAFTATSTASQVNLASSRNRRNIFRNSRSHGRQGPNGQTNEGQRSRPAKKAFSSSNPGGCGGTRKSKRSKPYDGLSRRSARSRTNSNSTEKQETSTPESSKSLR